METPFMVQVILKGVRSLHELRVSAFRGLGTCIAHTHRLEVEIHVPRAFGDISLSLGLGFRESYTCPYNPRG